MTTETDYPRGDPHRMLAESRDLAQRVRRAQRGTWFPLLVLAAVTFAAIPFYRYSGTAHFGTCAAAGHGPRACAAYPAAALAYWPAALTAAYAVIAAFYIRRSRARGIGTRARPYAIAGILIAAALTGLALRELSHPSAAGPAGLAGLGWRLATATTAIGLALLILARAERNRALLAVTITYLAVVLVPVTFGWTTDPFSRWYALPRLVTDGTILALAGLGFALAQRPRRTPAP